MTMTATTAIDPTAPDNSVTPAPSLGTPSERLDIKGLSHTALTEWVLSRGHKRYRAEQLFRWLHEKCATSLKEMSNLPRELRNEDELCLGGLEVENVIESLDGTRKIILRTAAGERLETVVIPMGKGRWTQCVSSQVGCKMGCDFCATAEMTRRKNLTVSEIIDQVYIARRLLGSETQLYRKRSPGSEPGKVDVANLVFMGMGEPLDNFQNLTTAIGLLLEPKGQAFGQRRITVSTVGLVPRIHDFARTTPVNIAVSLNATTDEQRNSLMPINRKFPIAVLMETLRTVPLTARRRIFVEYVMLGGVNDSNEDAIRLPKVLEGLKAKVNLIPFNPYPGSRYRSPEPDRILYFVDKLMKAGIQTNVREPKGRDIQAACGMLDGSKPI